MAGGATSKTGSEARSCVHNSNEVLSNSTIQTMPFHRKKHIASGDLLFHAGCLPSCHCWQALTPWLPPGPAPEGPAASSSARQAWTMHTSLAHTQFLDSMLVRLYCISYTSNAGPPPHRQAAHPDCSGGMHLATSANRVHATNQPTCTSEICCPMTSMAGDVSSRLGSSRDTKPCWSCCWPCSGTGAEEGVCAEGKAGYVE